MKDGMKGDKKMGKNPAGGLPKETVKNVKGGDKLQHKPKKKY